jgi:tetratricopeptide (TPR) repeat protein
MSMLVGVGLAREKWTEARARAMAAVPAAAAALCAVGIVLTQGRAGQAAALAGLWWLGVAWRVRPGRLRVALYAAPLVAGAIALAAATQIPHPAVEGVLLTLRYRLDYWGGALAVLRQDLRWLTGVGLENFGLFYVEHKPAWSPEEVSDPHNLVLSVWCSLGAAGLAAIISLAVLAVRSWLRPHRAAGGDAGLPGLMAPAALAAAPGMIVFFLVGPGWGVLALAAMTLAAALCAAEDPRRLAASGRAPASLRQAAIVALVAFALAETIGTAILEPPTAWAMLVLVAVTLVPRSRSRAASAQEPVISSEAREAGRVEKSRRGSHAPAGTARFLDSLRSLGMTDSCGETPSTRTQPDGPGVRLSAPLKFLLTLAMMGGMYAYLTGLVLPVGRERALLAEARAAETPEEQAELLRDAAAARPSSWEPHLLRARLWQDEAARGRGPQAAMAVERAVDAYRDVLERQPRLRFVYMAMADCLLGLPGSLEDPQALDAARHYLEEASRLYPTSIITRLRLADVTDRAGDEAAALDEYREVLRLDAATPEPALRLAPDIRAAVENRVRQLAESVATPAAVE